MAPNMTECGKMTNDMEQGDKYTPTATTTKESGKTIYTTDRVNFFPAKARHCTMTACSSKIRNMGKAKDTGQILLFTKVSG